MATERWREFQSEIAAALGRPLPLSECRMRGSRDKGKGKGGQAARQRKKGEKEGGAEGQAVGR